MPIKFSALCPMEGMWIKDKSGAKGNASDNDVTPRTLNQWTQEECDPIDGSFISPRMWPSFLCSVTSAKVFTINPVFPLDKGMQRTGAVHSEIGCDDIASPLIKLGSLTTLTITGTVLLHFVRGNLFAMSFQLIL